MQSDNATERDLVILVHAARAVRLASPPPELLQQVAVPAIPDVHQALAAASRVTHRRHACRPVCRQACDDARHPAAAGLRVDLDHVPDFEGTLLPPEPIAQLGVALTSEKGVRLAQNMQVGPCTWEYSYKRLKLAQLLHLQAQPAVGVEAADAAGRGRAACTRAAWSRSLAPCSAIWRIPTVTARGREEWRTALVQRRRRRG